MAIETSNVVKPGDKLPVLAESQRRLAFLRTLIWGLIGLVYAPLFIGLVSLFEGLGSGGGAYIAAAALAGGAGAALYTGREVALLGTGVGVVVGVASLLIAPEILSFQHAGLVAGVIAALAALHPSFPVRCDRQVPARVLVGLVTGALCGSLLGVAESLHPEPFSAFALLAVLASVNGILYVASVGPLLTWLRGRRLGSVPCNWIEPLVAGSLAALAAGSVWVMDAPVLVHPSALLLSTSDAVYRELALALLGGVFGGSLAGALLGAFGFPWLHEI